MIQVEVVGGGDQKAGVGRSPRSLQMDGLFWGYEKGAEHA